MRVMWRMGPGVLSGRFSVTSREFLQPCDRSGLGAAVARRTRVAARARPEVAVDEDSARASRPARGWRGPRRVAPRAAAAAHRARRSGCLARFRKPRAWRRPGAAPAARACRAARARRATGGVNARGGLGDRQTHARLGRGHRGRAASRRLSGLGDRGVQPCLRPGRRRPRDADARRPRAGFARRQHVAALHHPVGPALLLRDGEGGLRLLHGCARSAHLGVACRGSAREGGRSRDRRFGAGSSNAPIDASGARPSSVFRRAVPIRSSPRERRHRAPARG